MNVFKFDNNDLLSKHEYLRVFLKISCILR